jgi:hypothetical protein
LEFPAVFPTAGSGGGVTLSNYLSAFSADDAVVKLNWPDSSNWINSGSTLPTYDSADGSWVFQSQYLDAGLLTMNPQSNGFTMSTKIMFSSQSAGSRIIDFGSGQDSNNIFIQFLGSRLLHFSMLIPGTGGNRHMMWYDTIAIELSTWQMVTLVYYPALAQARVYVNGAVRATVAAVPAVSGPRTFLNCYIGKSHWFGEPNFSGRMKFLAVYDRALSETEILSQHATQAPPLNSAVARSFSLGCYLVDPPQSAYSFSSCHAGACGSTTYNLIKLNSVQGWSAGVGHIMIASFCVACIMFCGACSICDEACFKFVFS